MGSNKQNGEFEPVLVLFVDEILQQLNRFFDVPQTMINRIVDFGEDESLVSAADVVVADKLYFLIVFFRIDF